MTVFHFNDCVFSCKLIEMWVWNIMAHHRRLLMVLFLFGHTMVFRGMLVRYHRRVGNPFELSQHKQRSFTHWCLCNCLSVFLLLLNLTWRWEGEADMQRAGYLTVYVELDNAFVRVDHRSRICGLWTECFHQGNKKHKWIFWQNMKILSRIPNHFVLV